jgi:hypothetical protein
MRRRQFAAVLLLAVPVVCLAGNGYVKPTTTLTAQTANNTSAANNFSTQTNGNLGAGNVSKVNVHSLLYAGNTTKVYAHLMVWFGQSNHMNVGYSSTDPAQVKRQIADMISRGIDGVIIDWYGPNNSEDLATQLVMAEAELHPGFTFAVMVDQGAIANATCPGCTSQEILISLLQYVEQKYFSSPAYMTQQGHPVVTNFDIDLSFPGIDWNAVNAALSTHPVFVFQNNDGFSHTLSGGSYSWVMPTTTDYGMSYLSSFYKTGISVPSEDTVGATYKGFNDTLASWGKNRVMGQQCGQTWLKTFSEIKGLYNSGKQLPYLQLVTWNDYEEGSEIESGIDNCFALSPSVSGNTLQWTISGSESTVDHYRVYISTDGQNLMTLTDTLPGNRSVNLCSFPIPAGNYRLFVQAAGKASMANRMPGALSYTPSCNGSGSSSGLAFGAAPSSLTIAGGKSGSLTVSAKAQSGSFNNAISLACAGLPSALSCSFSPASITPGSGTATSVLTISAVSVSGMNLPRGKWNPVFATAVLPFGVAGFALIGSLQRRRVGSLRRRRGMSAVAIFLLVGLCLMGGSCGGKASAPQNAGASNYSVTIDGSSSSTQVSTTVTVAVQ